ncbi:hypothetical protein DRN74_06835 [Candidatus Micrarchaeota archaeon]|nr:MAG: hypothetical protein DRN74_06835 [Candidatus Micrarchaeota archaeon]
MNIVEWGLQEVRTWVVEKCWEEHKKNPGGVGILVVPDTLQAGDPPFRQICEVVVGLLGQDMVVAEFGRAFGHEGPIYIGNLKLTPKAVATIQNQPKKRPGTQIGFVQG